MGINTGFGLYDMSRAIIPNFWNESHNGIMHKGWNYMAGATIGWAFPLKNNWGIEPFIGAGYTYAKYDNFVNNQLVSSEKAKHLFAFTYKGGLFIYYKF
jgi:opacity protein-like surface antigen